MYFVQIWKEQMVQKNGECHSKLINKPTDPRFLSGDETAQLKDAAFLWQLTFRQQLDETGHVSMDRLTILMVYVW